MSLAVEPATASGSVGLSRGPMGKKSKGKGKKRDRGFEAARVGTGDWADGTPWTGATGSEAGTAAATEAGATAAGAFAPPPRSRPPGPDDPALRAD
jgi:hypothetical protein